MGQYVSTHGDVVSHVNISSAQVKDGGLYACTAQNTAGKAMHTARLNVYGDPHVRPMGKVSAVAGEPFIIVCPVAGYPIEKITWMKDGIELPVSHRQSVFDNGTLIVNQVTRGTDDGQYSCTARNNKGKQHAQYLTLNVIVPPRLVPVTFLGATRAGMRTQAVCLVQEGDQPLTINWFKEEKPIDQELSIIISKGIDGYSSTLVIPSAQGLHSGNYSCVVSNHAQSVTSSTSLQVSVPPTWVIEPVSTSVALGDTAELHCLAKGYPKPTLSWRKQTVSGKFVNLVGGRLGEVRTWDNGTLEIVRVQHHNEARYLCEANNNVGAGLSKVVMLQVNEPPRFPNHNQHHEVMVEETATLSCEAQGDAPLTLVWMKDNIPLPTMARYDVSEREIENGKISELSLQSTHIGDSGHYTCRATNSHGSMSTEFHLKVQDIPSPPMGMTVLEEGSRQLTLSWSPPIDSTNVITAYIISFYAQDIQSNSISTNGQQEITVEGDQQRVRIDNLSPATTYFFTIRAENRVGQSEPSAVLTVTTQEDIPTGYPVNIRVTAISSQALGVSWEPPSFNVTHGKIRGYYLGFKDASLSVSEGYNFTTVGVDGSGVTTATLAGLRPYKRYAIVLQAFNTRGAGPMSPETYGETLQDKPSAPPSSVACESATTSSLTITWIKPPSSHANGVILSYRVTYYASQLRNLGSKSVVSELTHAVISGLSAWTNYSFMVSASTEAGEGIASHAVICSTSQDVPEAVSGIKAVVSDPQSVMVSWLPPENPNGQITHYTLYWALVTSKIRPHTKRIERHKLHYKISDLVQKKYEVSVKASTEVGDGPSSTVIIVEPTKKAPAGIWSVSRNISTAWKQDVSLPCRAVGDPEPTITWHHQERQIIATDHAWLNRLREQPDGTLTIVDIQRGEGGIYICTAKNHRGKDTVIYNITVNVPPSAPMLHVTETTTSSIRVQWRVEDTGGSPLIGTTLHYRSDGGEWLINKENGRNQAMTVKGLQCGTVHHFYLTAHNAIGVSHASPTVEAQTKGRTPEAPPQFQFVTTNSSQATLYLGQWGSGGCPIKYFAVQYREAVKHNWITVGTEIPPSRTFPLGGLEPGIEYKLRVAAHNSAGVTPSLYTIKTPGMRRSETKAVSYGGVFEGVLGVSSTSIFFEPYVMISAGVSCFALILTAVTVIICLRKRPNNTNNINVKELPSVEIREGKPNSENTTMRRLPAIIPQSQQDDFSQYAGDYSEEELYPYATATFKVTGTPPPPGPPSPSVHDSGCQLQSQKAFSALVYQPPSLHDVDAANLGSTDGPRHHQGFPYEASETDDYGSVVMSSAEARAQHRRSRHNRNSRVQRSVHFP